MAIIIDNPVQIQPVATSFCSFGSRMDSFRVTLLVSVVLAGLFASLGGANVIKMPIAATGSLGGIAGLSLVAFMISCVYAKRKEEKIVEPSEPFFHEEILHIGVQPEALSEKLTVPVSADLLKKSVPAVILQKTLSFLQGDEAALLAKVSTFWRSSINQENSLLWRAQCEHLGIPDSDPNQSYREKYQMGFVVVNTALYWARKWERDFPVKIHNPPPFPRNIYPVLMDTNRISPNQLVKDSHVSTLIPPISLEAFETLLKHPRRGEPIGFHSESWDQALQKHGQTPPETDKYFCAQMTKAHLEGSRYQNYANCERLVAERGGALGYEIGNIRVVSMCIFTEYFNSGTRLYNEEDWDFTWVKEKTGAWNLVLGGFAHGAGPRFISHDSFYDFGVGPLRKFS